MCPSNDILRPTAFPHVATHNEPNFEKNVYVYIKYAQTVFLDVRFRVCEENYLPKNFHLLLHVLASHIEHICGFFFQTKALNRKVKVNVFDRKYSGPKIAHQCLAPIENQYVPYFLK